MFFDTRLGQDSCWWLDEVPCLHRLHETIPIEGAHKIQYEIGMSLSIQKMEEKLSVLSVRVRKSNADFNLQQKALLTFDDGHKDVLLAVPILKNFPDIQPVLFLTRNQLNNDVRPLPLTSLYTWCSKYNLNPNELESKYGFNRTSLKLLPENVQREILVKAGIDINPACEKMLNASEIRHLVLNGWLIGYHGSSHCDLRIFSSKSLEPKFAEDLALLRRMNYVPWIAWPEGRWNNSISTMACEQGFYFQFGLEKETGVGSKSYCINRKIWK